MYTHTHTRRFTAPFAARTAKQAVAKLRMPELRALLSASMLCTTWPEPEIRALGLEVIGLGFQF